MQCSITRTYSELCPTRFSLCSPKRRGDPIGVRRRKVPRFVLGLDLGQAADFTALAVVERDASDARSLAVRHLVRFPPGTPYGAIGDAVAGVVRDGGLGHPPLIVD